MAPAARARARLVSVLILGLGNPSLCDDGAGVHAARRARKMLSDEIDVREELVGGFALVESLSGYESAVIVDGIRAAGRSPGDILILEPFREPFNPTLHLISGREIDLAGARELALELGVAFPSPVAVVAIQVQDTALMSEECSAEVEKSLDAAAKCAIELAKGEPVEKVRALANESLDVKQVWP